MHIERNYPKISDVLSQKQSVFILGPRGVGKTYHLKRLLTRFPISLHIDLLSRQLFRRYLLQPSLFYDEIKLALSKNDKGVLYVMMDEIQLIPELLNEVHRCIEDFKNKVVFILTGSSARKLKRENSNLLAGRAIRYDFFPLTLQEIDPDIYFERVMKWGSLPEVIVRSKEEIVTEYLRTYVDTYLTEEIQRESEIRNLAGFSRFLELAAVENGNPVNYSKIGRIAGITGDTVKEYFQILVDTLIALEIPAWSHSARRRLQKASKFFFFDNGVMNALTGELRSELRPSTYRYGKLFENLVIHELYRENRILGLNIQFYHYRTSDGKEIDLILRSGPFSDPIAVEIKSGEAPKIKERSAIRLFQEEYPNSKRFVLCQTPRAYEKDGIEFVNFTEGIHQVLESPAKEN